VQMRNIALDHNIIEKILKRIEVISKETPRRYEDALESERKVKQRILEVEKQKEELAKSDKKDDKKKKKGVGYDPGSYNTKWSANDYIELRNIINEKLYHLVAILENFLNCAEFQVPKVLSKTFCESALLPLLENAYRSTSLVDMGKEINNYKIY
jgi:hypothetical protein